MTEPDPPTARPGDEPPAVPHPETPDGPEVPVMPLAPSPVTVRRAPRYRAFLGTGAALGAVLGIVLTAAFPGDERFSTGAVLGYLVVTGGLVGALLGGLVAVLADLLGHRRRP